MDSTEGINERWSLVYDLSLTGLSDRYLARKYKKRIAEIRKLRVETMAKCKPPRKSTALWRKSA